MESNAPRTPVTTKYMVRLESGAEYGPADAAQLQQWAQQRRIPVSAMLVPTDGSEPIAATALPELSAALSQSPVPPPASAMHPPTAPTAAVRRPTDDGAMSTLIPYRNAPALIAYYLAVFSLIPVVGILTGVAAFGLGIAGLRARRRDPRVHGSVHAWIGVIGGGGLAALWMALIIISVISAANA